MTTSKKSGSSKNQPVDELPPKNNAPESLVDLMSVGTKLNQALAVSYLSFIQRSSLAYVRYCASSAELLSDCLATEEKVDDRRLSIEDVTNRNTENATRLINDFADSVRHSAELYASAFAKSN